MLFVKNFVIRLLLQLAKVDWSGIANGVLTNLPGIIQASANAGKVRIYVGLVYNDKFENQGDCISRHM